LYTQFANSQIVFIGIEQKTGQFCRTSQANRQQTAGLFIQASGVSGLAGLVLGSVARQVVQHAGSPVLVVRPPAAEAS